MPAPNQQPAPPAAADEWLLWQLIDSAFPTGGFAHSAGLEAAHQQGELPDGAALASFLESALLQAGRSLLPFVMAAHQEADRFAEVDRFCDATLRSTVANRASRAQGQAMLIAIERTFAPAPSTKNPSPLSNLRAAVRRDQLPGHLAPIFGACTGILGLSRSSVAMAFMFTTLRSMISAAVRLAIVGPMQAQMIQHDLSSITRWIVNRFIDLPLTEVAQSAPLIDILQGGHDRLYSRLFQS